MPSHVLIVDDSPSIRRMIERSLSSAGFEVTACESADEAIAVATAARVDAVISDLNMPDMDGLALTRRLRTISNTASCPILILTTESSAARKQQAKEAGANGWVMKPFQEETLVRALRSVCQRAGAQR
jgi:two-component system chemotaxis response regulator CheY